MIQIENKLWHENQVANTMVYVGHLAVLDFSANQLTDREQQTVIGAMPNSMYADIHRVAMDINPLNDHLEFTARFAGGTEANALTALSRSVISALQVGGVDAECLQLRAAHLCNELLFDPEEDETNDSFKAIMRPRYEVDVLPLFSFNEYGEPMQSDADAIFYNARAELI